MKKHKFKDGGTPSRTRAQHRFSSCGGGGAGLEERNDGRLTVPVIIVAPRYVAEKLSEFGRISMLLN